MTGRHNPTPVHERIVGELGCLAALSGHTRDLRPGLPDGKRPDVLAVGLAARSLFIGEAKATEPGSDGRAAGRLLHYLRATDGLDEVRRLVVVGAPSPAQALGWARALVAIPTFGPPARWSSGR